MTAPYKKRAKTGWNSDKEQSNKDERTFVKEEINELLTMDESQELDKAPKKRKKKASKAKDIRNKIVTVERSIRFWSDRLIGSKYTHGIVQRYTEELKNLNQELLELEKK